jgi:hypothetical protein
MIRFVTDLQPVHPGIKQFEPAPDVADPDPFVHPLLGFG